MPNRTELASTHNSCATQLPGYTSLIDTGASVNVMDLKQYLALRRKSPFAPTCTRIYAYGGHQPLPLAGVTEVTISNGNIEK